MNPSRVHGFNRALSGEVKTSFQCILFVFATLLTFSPEHVFSSNLTEEDGSVSTHCSVTIETADEAVVILHEGKITAIEGKSVRLLPGTHIKPGKDMVVSVVSREHNEHVAEVQKKEEQKQVVETILRNQQDHPEPVLSEFMFRSPLANSPDTFIGSQMHLLAVIPPQVQSNTHGKHVQKGINTILPSINNLHIRRLSSDFIPYYSWGKRGEMIAVMRT